MKIKHSKRYGIQSINTVTNVVSISLNFDEFGSYTPYNLIENPTEYGARKLFGEVISDGAVYCVYFSNDGTVIEKNRIYYVRALTYTTCTVHASAQDAINNENKISVAGLSGGFIYGVHAGAGVINPLKAYATAKQCCPELAPVYTVPYYTRCTVTFNGYSINCILEPSPYFYMFQFFNFIDFPSTNKACFFVGTISNYLTPSGTCSLVVYVNIFEYQGLKKIKILVSKTVLNIFDASIARSEVFEGNLAYPYSGIISGSEFEGTNQVSYAFTTQGTLPATATLKLKQASFANGQNVNFIQLGQNKTKFNLPVKFGLGDIEEVLTFNNQTRCYESELKNYYNIPGRLTVPTIFFEENEIPFVSRKNTKYTGINDFVSSSNYLETYGNVSVFCITEINSFPPDITYDYNLNKFYLYYSILPNANPVGQLVVRYSFTQSALNSQAVNYYGQYSSDVEPFYRSEFFYIGSNEPGSFIEI